MNLAFNVPLLMEPMTEHDLDAVAALEAAAQPFPWNRQLFADSLRADHEALVLREGGLVLGFIILMNVLDESHLLNVAIHPSRQGSGLGARLLRHGMSRAANLGMVQMFLEVRPSNTRAEALYRHFGFVQVGRRKAYYPAKEGREDALVYCRTLEDMRS